MSAVETDQETGEDKVTTEQTEKTERAVKPGAATRISLAAGRVPPVAKVLTVVILAAAVIACGVIAGLKASQASDAATTQQNETAATAAAKSEIADVLSYSYKTQKQDVAQGLADSTGQFKGQFQTTLEPVLQSSAMTQQQITNKTVVASAAPLRTSGDQVVVLVFIGQQTTSKSNTKGQTSTGRIEATMQKVNGKWLISQFEAR